MCNKKEIPKLPINKCVEIIENNKYELSNDVLKKHLKLIQDLEEIKSKILIKE